MAKSLIMTFINAQGKKVSLTVNNIKDGLVNTDVSTVMDSIISKNIFSTAGGAFVSKDSAQIVEKTSSELAVK
jgi:hypothetical protein